MLNNKNKKHNFFRLISLIFFVIILKYFYIQIINYDFYKDRSGENHIYHNYIKAPRGVIYDRNGLKLVDNTQTFSVQIYPNYYNTDNFDKDLFYEMLDSAYKKSEILVNKNNFNDRIKRSRKHIPITIVDYIDFETRALINEYKLDFPGLVFYRNPARFYSDSLRLSHILGYLRPVDNKDLESGYYAIDDTKGKSGIEYKYENILRGKKGLEYRLINTYGQDLGVDEKASNISEIPGKDLSLTIDFDLQLQVEKLLRGYRGAVICMNPKNGEILAIASAPDYSLNEFIGPLSTKTWNDWNKENILVNRALRGRYGPASIYKLVVGIMFIDKNEIPINKTVHCPGFYKLPDKSNNEGFIMKHCWKEEGHGDVDLHDAITQSCNVYFYDMILQYQTKNPYIINILSDYAKKLGFNKKTGIVLSELSGKIPDSNYMKEIHGKKWSRRGEMVNLVIGQGDNIVTPIQIINFMNLIATKGKTFKPKLILNDDSIPFEIEFTNYVWSQIQSAMYSVINDKKGTGYIIKNDNVDIYGKTGTLQLTALNESGESKQNSLFSGYVEENGEMMSLVVVIEDVDENSKSISKQISKNIFDYYISNNLNGKR